MPRQQIGDEPPRSSEARFVSTRRRVFVANLAFFTLFLVSVLSAVLLGLAGKRDEARAGLLIATIAWMVAGAALVLYNRKKWRCPSCSKRWPVERAFPRKDWNYCPECGVALRRVPSLESDLDERRTQQLQRRVRRDRRLRTGLAVLLLPALVAVASAVEAVEFSDTERDVLIGAMLFPFVVAYLYLSRCPNCKKELMLKRERYCPRCGVKVK